MNKRYDSDLANSQPDFSGEQARLLAGEFFGVTGDVVALPSERDQNFRITGEDGKSFVLKISNLGEELATLEFQQEMLLRIQGSDQQLETPVLQESRAGQTIHQLDSGHWIRLVSYIEGKPLAKAWPRSAELLENIGCKLGRVDKCLQDLEHPAARRAFKWDIRLAGEVIEENLATVQDKNDRQLIENCLQRFQPDIQSNESDLRQSVIHNDANDYNLIIHDGPDSQRLTGLIDFGDAIESFTIAELAITCAYAMLDKSDPLQSAAHVVRGYHSEFELKSKEVAILFNLIAMRLATSLSISHAQAAQQPDNDYLLISAQPIRQLLEKLGDTSATYATSLFRASCGWEPYHKNKKLAQWLTDHRSEFASVVAAEAADNWKMMDFSVGSKLMVELEQFDEVASQSEFIFERLTRQNVELGVGRYAEPRLVYQSDQFTGGQVPRTIHLGIDLFMPAGTAIHAPIKGRVHSFQDNALPLDYGPTIILEHDFDEGGFYTLYGHLSADSITNLQVGQAITAGDEFARMGEETVNGGWVPHLHFQIIGDMLEKHGDFPGVAPVDSLEVWKSICPDPNMILNLDGLSPFPQVDLLQARRRLTSDAFSLAYRKPLNIVKGKGQFLYDADGLEYLDCVNNVCHVGHSHPDVVAAISAQASLLNTNTRYLNSQWIEFVEKLLARFPAHLNRCALTCSGSEANELAVRMARAHTRKQDIAVLDHGYHGNTSTLIELSPYKFNGPGGRGPGRLTHVIDLPTDADFSDMVQQVKDAGANNNLAAILAESISGCGGQVVFPQGFLHAIYDEARNQGAVCIADEVQTGFGRMGIQFWAFETQGVTPDIVTLGKPIGNGHPLGAVVTTAEIADSFCDGMEYFNTFGGNPVSCAAGLAVLDVIEREELQAHAERVGNYLIDRLRGLQEKHSTIKDVRGVGLFLGVELQLPKNSPPNTEQLKQLAKYVIEKMKERRILLSLDGPNENVIKIKPPMVFTDHDADRLCRELDGVLSHTAIAEC